MSKTKRVVVTGMGIVSSIGNNVETVRNSLMSQNQVLLVLIYIKKWDLEAKSMER
jgi:3-oxoacyl-(acyl-carrier-protein) synthase